MTHVSLMDIKLYFEKAPFMAISSAGGEAIRLLLEVNGIIQVSINGD